MKQKKGFTLLELLIVLGLISMIMILSSVVYSSAQKKSRDAKRKGDLNIIRSALDLFRADYSFYPGSLTTATFQNNYLKIIPSDPKSPQVYRYQAITCDSGLRCDYTLGTRLENSNATTCLTGCGGISCNYCLGPNGEK